LVGDNNHINLLANYKKIDEMLHDFASKIYNQNINVFADDLPKKLSELRFDIKKLKTYKELILAKETMLSKVLEKGQAEVQVFE
jgi:hypothetical protein